MRRERITTPTAGAARPARRQSHRQSHRLPPPPPAGLPRPPWLHRRRLARGAALLLVATAPFFDVLRLDLPSRSAVLLGRHLWLGDLYLLLLLLLGTMFAFAAVSVILGRVFCGWLCPQTTVTAIALATVRLLSPRRPPLPEPLSPAALSGWRRALFHAAAAAASLLGGFALAAYFVAPARLVGNLVALPVPPERPVLLLFLGLAAGLYLDATLLRHRLCLVCPLGAAMSVLRGETALQVGVPPDRVAEACGRCTACRRLCPFGLDPRRPDPRLCTNCGDCLVACAAVSAARGADRPLRFTLGPPRRPAPTAPPGNPGGGGWLVRGRALLAAALAGVLLTAFAVGLARRPAVGLAVLRPPGSASTLFQALVRNQTGRALTVELSVHPPPRWGATLDPPRHRLGPGAQALSTITLAPPADAAAGPHAFTVQARPGQVPARPVRLRAAVFLEAAGRRQRPPPTVAPAGRR